MSLVSTVVLVSGSKTQFVFGIQDTIYFCLEMGSPLLREEGFVVLSGHHICYNEQFLCRMCTGHLSVQASTPGYALTNSTTPKQQVVT
jgi:hypothetical protein